jgi:hypothetical protein
MSAQRQSAAAEEQRKRLIVYGVFAAALIAFVVFAYTQFFGGSTPAPVPVAVAPVTTSKPAVAASAPKATGAAAGLGAAPGVAAVKMASTSSSLDPTLDETAMLRTESLVYAGTGRNIFSATYVPPVVIPKNAPPARPVAAAQPAVYVPQGPPPPPPINLKFFGTEMRANGQRQAFLLQGEDVYLAAQGDIVARRYKIVAIGENHIEVEDLVNGNKQSLPLQMN